MKFQKNLSLWLLFSCLLGSPVQARSLCEKASATARWLRNRLNGSFQYIESKVPALAQASDTDFAFAATYEIHSVWYPDAAVSSLSHHWLKLATDFTGTNKISTEETLSTYGIDVASPFERAVRSGIMAIHRQGSSEPIALYELWESTLGDGGMARPKNVERLYFLNPAMAGQSQRTVWRIVDNDEIKRERLKIFAVEKLENVTISWNRRSPIRSVFHHRWLNVKSSRRSEWTEITEYGAKAWNFDFEAQMNPPGQNYVLSKMIQLGTHEAPLAFYQVWERNYSRSSKGEYATRLILIDPQSKKRFFVIENP